MNTKRASSMQIEGVTYRRFRIRFRLASGQRRVWIRWSPGWPFVVEEFRREAHDRDLVVRPGSDVIISPYGGRS